MSSIKGSGPPTAAVVPVFTALASKINWTNIFSFIAIGFGIFNVAFSAELQANLIIGIMAFAGLADLVTILLRTRFTKSVTPASVAGAPEVNQSKPVAAVTPPGDVVTTLPVPL